MKGKLNCVVPSPGVIFTAGSATSFYLLFIRIEFIVFENLIVWQYQRYTNERFIIWKGGVYE
ncbi:hypothetical protein [Proteiniphilum saccharofermentans]|uniref:hypothetical protein n=1 Tax=Proteiniphilum saccharofermentans TaxID=1642647 RepID=UPI000B868797|nr:hypothetical protein [Proteiniphilum saccharofermentans]